MSSLGHGQANGQLRRLLGRLRTSGTVRLTAASATIVATQVIGTAATFGYTLFMARVMTPDDLGLVWLLMSGCFIAATFATLNLSAVATREVVQARSLGDDDRAAGFITFCRVALAAASPVVIIAFLGLFWWRHPNVVESHPVGLILSLLTIPIIGWNQLNAAQAVALHIPARGQAPRSLVRPLLFLGFMTLAWGLDARVSVEAATGLYLVAVFAAAVLQIFLVRSAFGFLSSTKPSWSGARGWIISGMLLAPSRLLADQLKNILMLAGSLMLSTVGLAHLNIALSVVTFLNFSVTAVEMGFASRTAAAVVQGQEMRAVRLMVTSGLAKFLPIMVLTVVLVAFIDPIVGLFGPAYAESGPAALWLLSIPLAKLMFGNSALILQIRGLQVSILFTSLAALVALLLCGPILAALSDAGDVPVRWTAQAFALVLVCMLGTQWAICLVRTGIDTSLPGSALRLLRLRRGAGL